MTALALALAAVTAALALGGAGPAALLRHAYLAPVIAGALRFGVPGGVLTAVAAILLSAPFVLPEIERSGLTGEAAEGLVSFAVLAAVGALAGVLRSHGRRERARYETILSVQRAVADEPDLAPALRRLRAVLLARLPADAVALAVRDGERFALEGGARVAPGSAMDRVLAGGRPLFVPDAGGGPRPRRVFVTPLRAAGEALGALAVERAGELGGAERAALEALGAHVGLALEHARLVARQRRFAEELARKVADATARLAEIDRAKSAFVATVSHELRTPLTALQGFSEILAERPLPPGEVARAARIMHGEARRLGRIVSDLLDLARIERGLEPALRRAPVAPADALGAAVDVMRRAAPHHRLELECAPDLPPLDADADALERVLLNLLGNAVKYSPSGSTVRVRARAVPGAVELEVEDEGRGIAPEALPRVFEPYYREPGAAAAAAGAGIGLAVVKSLVEAHGGTIRLDSAPGRGTRVTVHWPAVP